MTKDNMSQGECMVQDGTHYFMARIYYENTDAQGAVYHGEYLKFAERGRTEFLRHYGIFQEDLKRKEGCIFVISQLNIKYKEACFLDDLIVVETSIKSLTPLRLNLSQILKVDERVKAEISVDVAMVEIKYWRPIKMPSHIIHKLQESLHD